MTARATEHTEPAPSVIDLRAPGVYEEQVRLARTIAQYIEAMPLDAMQDKAEMAWLIPVKRLQSQSERRNIRADRDMLEVLAFAQRQLVKIRERGGE